MNRKLIQMFGFICLNFLIIYFNWLDDIPNFYYTSATMVGKIREKNLQATWNLANIYFCQKFCHLTGKPKYLLLIYIKQYF